MDNNNAQNDQPEQKENNYIGVLVVLIVLVLLGAGLFYVVNSGMLGGKQPVTVAPVVSDTGSPAEKPALVKPDFTYKVKSVSAETIVLQGKNGDFTLPNDSASVQVYAGPTKESAVLPLSQLKVGDNVNIEFVPGESASLFVL